MSALPISRHADAQSQRAAFDDDDGILALMLELEAEHLGVSAG
jgi:hypothetical protein